MAEKPTVLAISAHSSDFIMRCGGTLAKYARNGSKVTVLALSFGERGETVSLWKENRTMEEVKNIRRDEAQQAANILGVEVKFLDWDDHPLIFDTERLYLLAKEIRSIRPDIVLTHHTFDPTNPDHAVTGDAAVKACRYAIAHGIDLGVPVCQYPVIFYFEPNLPTEQALFVPDTFINITETFEQKMKALKEIKTQPFLSDIFALRNRYRALVAPEIRRGKAFEYAESFVRFAPLMSEEFIL